MDIRELRDALRDALPDAELPTELPADDMYPFAFASKAFITPFMDALVRVEVCDPDGTGNPDGPGQTPDEPARARLERLAGLLERVFADGDDETVDPLAVRLVFNRLVRRPRLLAAAWPYLGPHTRGIAHKFLVLDEQCQQREAEARRAGPPGPPGPPSPPGPPGTSGQPGGPAPRDEAPRQVATRNRA